MITGKELNAFIQKQAVDVKVPHSTSFPMLYVENGKVYLSAFTFFYTKKDIENGTVSAPTLVELFDIETGVLIKKFDFMITDKKYDIRMKSEIQFNKTEYYDIAFSYLDKCRKEIIEKGTIDKILYQTYVDMILATIPDSYKRFYQKISIDTEMTGIKEFVAMTPNEKLELYIENNKNRLYIPLKEFKLMDFCANAQVFYMRGRNTKDPGNKKWNRSFAEKIGDRNMVPAYPTYEMAEQAYKDNNLETWNNPYRIISNPCDETLKQVANPMIFYSTKQHSIRVLDDDSISPDFLLDYYKKECKVHSDENCTDYTNIARKPTITMSNVIDWLLELDPDMSEIRMEHTAEKFLKYSDIALAVQYHIENDNYDNSISIEGYTAKKLHDEVEDKLSIIGIYNYLIYLKESPKEALHYLALGLPRK